MKIYRVGGAVRDELLGRPVQDTDHVVVGATVDEMLALGFQPVGKDFPVFLHPVTREEYALARTERKSGRGYRGFDIHASPEVTLEEDLGRRDLTVNAMARDEAGTLIDPFGGLRDLHERVLRHISPAFVEDPVRILRVARFCARLGFRVAEDTLALMRHMVDIGEVDHLVPERVWQEISRGLMEEQPAVLFDVLSRCGALARIAPEWAPWIDPRGESGRDSIRGLARAACQSAPLEVRFALSAHRAGSTLDTLCERLRTPTDCQDLARLCARFLGTVRAAPSLDAPALVDLLYRVDAFRRPARFHLLTWVAAIEDDTDLPEYAPAATLTQALQAATTVDSAALARGERGPEAGARIRAARIEAVRQRTAEDAA